MGFYLWTRLFDKSCRGAVSKMDSTSKQRKGCHSARVQIHFVLDERNFQILQMTVFASEKVLKVASHLEHQGSRCSGSYDLGP